MIQYTYRCPHCRGTHVDYTYAGQEPVNMGCRSCGRVTPRPAWELVAARPLAPRRRAPAETPPDPEDLMPLHDDGTGRVRGHTRAAYLICPACQQVVLWQVDGRGNWVERTCPLCGHHTDRPASVVGDANLWLVGRLPAMPP